MDEQLRILIAAALARVIEPALVQHFPSATVVVATTRGEVEHAVQRRPRFDVVISDLLWNSSAEYTFDGLDVLGILRAADRESPVIIATQGHTAEQDHLDEAVERDIVWGVFRKSGGPALLLDAVERVGRGERLPTVAFPTGASRTSLPRIHTYFATTRGRTAARMAGAIASGRAISHKTLAEVARVEYDTASKIGREYLGDLICRRGEHISNQLPAHVPAPVVYRWCGEHARYILSWCRRNGQTDVATRAIPLPHNDQFGNDASGLGRAGRADDR
ncbi:response regulator [Kribbella sp. VKM Ac-2568]|uniref:response regulator n=1 Tax=Kribbella sp. VKM Ac-2568 TaxID=2512219 RepID=UPI0018EE8850|nr:response regulator [Kribbella sp. VKM Ac-2568]